MKNLLIAASALSLIAGAASAAELNDGYVGLNYSQTNVFGDDVNVTSLRGVGSWNVSKTYELQLDGDVANVDYGPDSTIVWGPTAHLFANAGNYKAGAFLGYLDADNTNVFGGGVETRFFPSDNISVGGSVGWGSIDMDPYNLELTTVRGDVSYFVNDNFRLDAFASKTDAKVWVFSAPVKSFGVGGEYLLSNAPISFTLNYENSDSNLLNVSANTYSVGVRYVFGGNLRARDRNSSPFSGLMTNLGGGLAQALTGAIGGGDTNLLGECGVFDQCAE